MNMKMLMMAAAVTPLAFSAFAQTPEAVANRASFAAHRVSPGIGVKFRQLPMRYGDTSRTQTSCAKDPTVIRHGDRYLMYYSLPPIDEETRAKRGECPEELNSWASAIAESRDLVNWRRIGDMDLRDTAGRRVLGAAAPCVKRIDGRIHLFYQRYLESARNNVLWLATSEDGIRFTNAFDEPVFVPRNKWAKTKAIDAEVYRVGDSLMLLYATRDAATGKVQQLGMAKAPYGSDYSPARWTELTVDTPFFGPEKPWEQRCIEAPTVIEAEGVWYLFYAGSFNNARQQIGLATSTDGLHYRRYGHDGLVFPCGCAGTWNSCESGHPGVFRDDDGRIYMFYQGKSKMPGASSGYELSCAEVILSANL